MPLSFTIILTDVSETYDFFELHHDLWRFIPNFADAGLFPTISQFKIYITFIAKTFITIVQDYDYLSNRKKKVKD